MPRAACLSRRTATGHNKGVPIMAKQSASQRGATKWSPQFVRRLNALPQRDRAIVELTLPVNLSRDGIARAVGVTAGQVTRRLRTLYARLHDPLVVALFDKRCPLSREYRLAPPSEPGNTTRPVPV